MKSPQKPLAGPHVALFAVAVTFVATSCFDAHPVDPGVLTLDDFDHGALPADFTFTPWMCFSYNPNTNQNYSCAHDTDTLDGSPYSLRLDFAVTDPANGLRDYGGVGLATFAPFGVYQDVTGFATLGFDARVQSGIPALPSDAFVDVLFGCSTAPLTDGSTPGDQYVVQSWRFNGDGNWGRGTISFANFSPADTELIDGGVAGCLRRVDQVAFQVSPQLPDGQAAAGILHIDNVYLK